MANPSITNRGSVSAPILEDGFSTLITLANAPSIAFKEKSVTPPGVEGGDPIDTSTMHSVTWRNKAPRSLKEMTDASATVSYDPAVYDDIIDQVNVQQAITITYPDGTQMALWGFLRNFSPGELSEGDQPTAEVTFVFTMYDPENCIEAGMTLTVGTGTCR